MPHSDPEARQRYNRDYKRSNRWRYAARQKAYDAATHANERAARYGVPGTITPEEAAGVLGAGRCFYCDTTDPSTLWSVDHREPLSGGGANALANLVCACHSCNARKHRGDHPDAWSNSHPCCVACGSTDSPHAARGRCRRCWLREYRARLSRGPL